MIKVKYSAIHQYFFMWYFKKIINKNFSHFWLVNELPQRNKANPCVFTPNHISWWDGFIMYCILKKKTRGDFRIMMLEEQLSRYRYFSRIGAFSIDPGKPKSMFQTTHYMHELLTDPENLVVFYPQGKMEPYWKRPQDIKSGITRFLKVKNTVDVIPVACSVNPSNKKKPEIIMRFGEILSSKDIISDIEFYKKKYHKNLSLCDAAIIKRDFYMDCLPF